MQLRDGISILERCLQDGETKISEEKIKDLVGIPKIEHIHKITKAIIEYDVDTSIDITNTILNEGKELNNFLWEIIKYIKDLLVLKASKEIEIYNEQEKENMQKLIRRSFKTKTIKFNL